MLESIKKRKLELALSNQCDIKWVAIEIRGIHLYTGNIE